MTHFDDPQSVNELVAMIGERLQRPALHIAAKSDAVSRVAWCTGAAHSMLAQAEALQAEMFVSGEVSEPTVHSAREMGIHYLAAGHHATERYGVKALGEHLAERFGIAHYFVDIDNPV
jgi:putative NIF3 family GTP cyclohydrolase 1 type 2